MTFCRAACRRAVTIVGRAARRLGDERRPYRQSIAALGILIVLFTGCKHGGSVRPVSADPSAFAPSPRLIVGRILAVDAAQGFAFIELASDPPAGALADGSELVARTLELKETAQLRGSRYLRGRTLGAKIVAGQPSPGNEVVWLAP